MFRGPLPGFYWDEEKRKYFQLQTNHKAPASPYTKEKVEKAQREGVKRKREEKRQSERKRCLIQRAPGLHLPAAGRVSNRDELGYSARSKICDNRSRAFTRSLNPTVSLNLCDDVTCQFGMVPSRQEYTIQCFDYDAATHGLVVGVSQGPQSGFESVLSVLPDDDMVYPRHNDQANDDDEVRSRRIPHYSFSKLQPIQPAQSPISSINLNSRTRTLITTTSGDKYSPQVHITQLVDPGNAHSSQPLDNGMSSLFRPPNLTTIYTSRCNPWILASGYEHIAVAASTGIIGFIANSTGSRNWRSFVPMATDSDVLTLDWISPYVLAAGSRDATVVLYDMRVRDGIKRMKHSSAVIGLRRADCSSRFVVAGMENQMALYDMKMLRDSDVPEPSSPIIIKNGKKRSQGRLLPVEARKSALPLVRFEYNNVYDFLGMDVHAELGLVAAAESDGKIRISSMRTGETMKSFVVNEGTTRTGASLYDLDDKIKCVRFVEDSMGVAKVMASCGPKIVEIAW